MIFFFGGDWLILYLLIKESERNSYFASTL